MPAAESPAQQRNPGPIPQASTETRFVVTVDTEEEWDWNFGWPTGTPRVSNIQELPGFQEICDRHRAAVTYFTNYPVLHNDESLAVIQDLAKKPRVEIGMHIHPWNTPPIDSRKPISARESFLANLPEDMITQKLATVYDLFLQRQLKPTSFRGGRYSSGRVVQRFLAENGFVADASQVPFTTWGDEGAPDYRDRGLSPHRHCPLPGRPVWEIPLTLGFTRRPYRFWSKCYQTVANSFLSKFRLIGMAERLNLVRRVWLSFESPLGTHMLQFLRQLRSMKLPYICFTFHSSSLLVGANGCFSNTASERDRLLNQLDEVLGVISNWPEFRPATITEIAQSLESEYHARSRN